MSKKFLSDVLIECGLQVDGTTTLGTATATTVATSDNSTNIATTAWVKALGYSTTDSFISNVSFSGSTLSFTGINSAFTGSLDLSALSTQLTDIETVYASVRNVSGVLIPKGTPLATVIGQTSGNVSDVVPADASDPAFMPALFVADEDIAEEAEGRAVAYGEITGIDTSLYPSGTTVYVAPGGGWTDIKPTGTDLIQNLGVITKQHNTNGGGIVTGVGRSNDVPNIPQGYAWVGNANGVATPTLLGSLAYSSATYDNYGSWNLKTNGVQRTTVQSGGNLDIVAGTNVSVSYSAGGVVTISSTDTNTNNYLTGLSFATGTGVLTATRQGLGDLTVDLDGRYQPQGSYVTYASSRIVGDASAILTTSISPWDISTASDAPTGSVDGILTTGMWDWNGWGTQSYHDFHTNTIYIRSRQNSVWQNSWATVFTTDNFTDSSSNWNTAYGWGDHATQGYLTSFDITTQTDAKYLRSDVDDTFGDASKTLTIQGVVRSTNNGNIYGPNFNVSTTNKDTAEYAYRVDRSGTVVGGITIGGQGVFADGLTVGVASFTANTINNWNTAYGWGNHALQGYLTSYTETDTLATVTSRGASTTSAITTGGITATYGWFGGTGIAPQIRIFTENGTASIADTFVDTSTDKSYIHFLAGTNSNDPGYIMHETSESADPDERNEGVLHLVPSDDNSYGDYVSIHGTNDPDCVKIHTNGMIETSSSYQLQLRSGSGYVRVDDGLSVASQINTDSHGDSSQWNTAYGWGDHSTAGYLTSFTETDPIFTASAASSIAAGDITNWNNAFAWGDHSAEGYMLQPQWVQPITSGFGFHDDLGSAGDLNWAIGATDRGGVGQPGQNAFIMMKRTDGVEFTGLTGGTEVFTLDDSGNLGLSNSTPVHRLDVNGNIMASGYIMVGNNTAVRIATGGATGAPTSTKIESFDSATFIGAFLDFTIYDDGKEHMRSGTLQVVFNGVEARFNEVNTLDIGDTSQCTLDVQNNGGIAEVFFTSPDPSYHIKYQVRTL